jgi:hypothetical protein
MNFNFNKLLRSIISKIGDGLRALALDALLFVFLIVLIEVLFGEFLFYEYGFLAENQEPKASESSFQFKENIYKDIIIKWQERDKKIQDFSQKNYPNPF